MNGRDFTNIVKYFMDEWFSTAIRDSKFLMFLFYYYTLDEYVRFFPYKWMLEQEMKMKFYSYEKIHSNLVFIGDMKKEKSTDPK